MKLYEIFEKEANFKKGHLKNLRKIKKILISNLRKRKSINRIKRKGFIKDEFSRF